MRTAYGYLGAAIFLAACGGRAEAPTGGGGHQQGSGGGGEGGGAMSSGTGGGGSSNTGPGNVTSAADGSTASAGPTSGSAGQGTSSSGAAGAHLVVPNLVDLPYVVAGQGGSSAMVTVKNDGQAPLQGLSWSIEGDASITLGAAPAALSPGESGTVTLSFAGSSQEVIASASLKATGSETAAVVPVFAVAGDPGLGAAAWADVKAPNDVVAGSGATVAMPAAPYPTSGGSFTDPSVRVFIPEGYRDAGGHDVVVHFHGFSTTLAATLAGHLYEQHVYASGSNAILVVPQGPVNAASGDFGKLMLKGGLSRLLSEVLVLLYREGKITSPVLERVALTSHSGGYQAVAYNLTAANAPPAVGQVDLYDSLYGYDATFESFATHGGVLRSNYTTDGGTVTDNQSVATYLSQNGLDPETSPAQTAWASGEPVIWFSDSTHEGSTRTFGAYGEELRWKAPRSRRGPRIELRSVVEKNGTAEVKFLAPQDEELTGYSIETSVDGVTWSEAASAAPGASSASFALPSGRRVRVKGKMPGIDPADVLPSDTYRIDPAASILVVDGFDRILDGSFGGLHHDFAALVGEGAGKVASISHRALTEDGFDLSPWPTVVWLAGDQSTADRSITTAEQQLLTAYVDAGGSLLVSGSEVGYDLSATTAGTTFLAHCFGAKFVADNSNSLSVTGQGTLAGLGAFGYAGAGAAYPEDYPDVLGATAGGVEILRYASGQSAAVGVAGKGALVGFPLELVDAGTRAAVVKALVGFVQ